MQKTNTYNWLQIALHWGIAGLILLNYLAGEGIEDAFDAMMEGKAAVAGLQPNLHIYVGLAVLALVVLRLILRLIRPVALVDTGKPLADRLAEWVHWALYALMLAVPALGALAWYGRIDLSAELHVLAMNALMLLALGHAVMALFHQFVLKDGLLRRMLRTS